MEADMATGTARDSKGHDNLPEEDSGENIHDPRSSLYEIAGWFHKSKETLSDAAQRHGEAEEGIRLVADSWPEIEPVMSGVDPVIVSDYAKQTSGSIPWFRSHDPMDPSHWWHDDPATLAQYFVSSAATGTTVGGAFLYGAPPPDPIVRILDKRAEDDMTRQSVHSALVRLSPDVARKFEQAWQLWYTGDEDAGASALLVMREAVDHTIKHLSQNGQPFKGRQAEQREKRVEWIADNLVKDALRRPSLVWASQTSQRLYSKLSERGKKRGAVPPDIARALPIEAQDFIHLLLDACGVAGCGEA